MAYDDSDDDRYSQKNVQRILERIEKVYGHVTLVSEVLSQRPDLFIPFSDLSSAIMFQKLMSALLCCFRCPAFTCPSTTFPSELAGFGILEVHPIYPVWAISPFFDGLTVIYADIFF